MKKERGTRSTQSKQTKQKIDLPTFDVNFGRFKQLSKEQKDGIMRGRSEENTLRPTKYVGGPVSWISSWEGFTCDQNFDCGYIAFDSNGFLHRSKEKRQA